MNKEIIGVILNNELNVEGICSSPTRQSLLERVIADLQDNPEQALKDKYAGIKNYAHFGDQVSCHPYGFGPTHGSIVFRIGRGTNYTPDNAHKYIQFLLYFRDANGIEYRDYNGYERKYNLARIIKERARAKEAVKTYTEFLDALVIEQ